jgi:hypothetical protein
MQDSLDQPTKTTKPIKPNTPPVLTQPCATGGGVSVSLSPNNFWINEAENISEEAWRTMARVTCTHCSGSGKDATWKDGVCRICGGSGTVYYVEDAKP